MGAKHDMATCVDCGARRRVFHREWQRAAPPRCWACGGRVAPSAAAAGEHADHLDAVREQRAKEKKTKTWGNI